jgi:hypothetical protein
MKTENMKLLDLQTGKYLELEKDFYYGCNTIMLHCYTKEELTEYKQRDDYNPHYLIDDADYNNPEKYHKIIHNGFQEAIDRDTATVRLFTEHQSEPQGILKTLCDKTGAVVYGGRYVLVIKDYNIQIGDLWKNSKYRNTLVACINFKNNIHFKHNISGGLESFFEEIRNDDNDNIIVRCSQNENSEFLGNIFEEYSKQLRKEENKFDELMEKLN